MANGFLSSSEISNLTGLFQKSFETFSYERTRTITVYKEPLQNISSITGVSYPGYFNSESNNANVVSYTPVFQSFPAVVSFDNQQTNIQLNEEKVNIPKKSQVKIRVEQDCADYIEFGRIQSIYIDGFYYNMAAERETSSFLGLKHYIYYLSKTQ